MFALLYWLIVLPSLPPFSLNNFAYLITVFLFTVCFVCIVGALILCCWKLLFLGVEFAVFWVFGLSFWLCKLLFLVYEIWVFDFVILNYGLWGWYKTNFGWILRFWRFDWFWGFGILWNFGWSVELPILLEFACFLGILYNFGDFLWIFDYLIGLGFSVTFDLVLDDDLA